MCFMCAVLFNYFIIGIVCFGCNISKRAERLSSFLGHFTAVVDWIAMCGVNIMFLFFLSCGLSQFVFQEFACIRLLACCHFLRGTARDKVAALLAALGAKVYQIVGTFYYVHVVLNDYK